MFATAGQTPQVQSIQIAPAKRESYPAYGKAYNHASSCMCCAIHTSYADSRKALSPSTTVGAHIAALKGLVKKSCKNHLVEIAILANCSPPEWQSQLFCP